MSASEHARWYTRPVQPSLLSTKIPTDHFPAHETLLVKRKLNVIHRSKSTQDSPVFPGDLVQIYIKNHHEKCGSWTSAKPVLTFHVISQTVTVPGSKGRTVKAAVEDVRHAIVNDEFALVLQEAIDERAIHLDIAVDKLVEDPSKKHEGFIALSSEDNELRLNDNGKRDAVVPPSIGDKISGFWPDNYQYYPGTVSGISYGALTKIHVNYDDRDKDVLDLNSKILTYVSDSALSAHMTELCSNDSQDLS